MQKSRIFKTRDICKHFLYIRVLVILYNELLYKYEFGQAHFVELIKRSPTKFSLQFLGISIVFYEF
jgi:hypothetical protein